MPACILAGVVSLLLSWNAAAVQSQSPAPPGPSYASPVPARTPSAHDIETEARVAVDPRTRDAWLHDMSLAFGGEPADLEELQRHASAVLSLFGQRLTRQDPDWPAHQSTAYVNMLVIDRRRFLYDLDFRVNVIPVVAAGIADEVPPQVRRRMLESLRSYEFGLVERVEVAWGLAPRSSRPREVRFEAVDLTFGSTDAIRASIYSLPSAYFDFQEAAAFLRSVHAIAPERPLVVLSNRPLIGELELLRGELPLRLIDTLARPYTPWPRDPFVVAQSARGPVTLVVRPNLQAQRELDVFMAREIVQNLPEDLDQDWQRVQWTLAPVPFHGGHMLTEPDAVWVSVHTLIPRIKERLGMQAPIDLQELRHAAVLSRFLAATREVIGEFEEAFDTRVRMVHPLPQTGSQEEIDALQVALGGGDGHDLDSLVTIVTHPDGRHTALIGDLQLGRKSIEAADATELRRIRELYHLVPEGDRLRRELAAAQSTPPNRQRQAFLDDVAAYLRRQDIRVERLPLVKVPQTIVDESLYYSRDGFLISWNNVVLQEVAGTVHAEGFASGLAGADELARSVYTRVGVQLDYVAPLALSIMRDGGYRCASNHVR